MHDPEDVHLERDELRFRLAHQHVEDRSLGQRAKLVAVIVIRKDDVLLVQRLAPLIEVGRGFARIGLAELRFCVRNPRAGDVLQPQRLGFGDDAGEVLRQPVVLVMRADRLEPAVLQELEVLGDGEVVERRELDLGNTEAFTWSKAFGTSVLKRSRKL